MNDLCQNNWLPCPMQRWCNTGRDDLKWYRSSGHFLKLFLWQCRPIYTSCMGSTEYTSHCTNATYELNQAHERTGASLCESVTALAASVLIRNDNASLPLLLHNGSDGCPRGTPSHNKDAVTLRCQVSRLAALTVGSVEAPSEVNKLRFSS